MTTLAIIIARAGSKGLANKNMRPLGGKPLLAWTLEHALSSRRVDHVVLSSDGQDMLNLARAMGAHAYFRPAEFSHDTATVDSAARHGVECWEREHDTQCDHVALLYGNVALRPADLTDRAIGKLIETGADSVQTVFPVGKMHPLWMRKLTGANADKLENYQPNEIYRRQDLPPVFMLNSGVLALTRQSLFNVDPAHPHQFLGTDRRAVVTAEDEVIDIDTELDLALAEVILQMRRRAAQDAA